MRRIVKLVESIVILLVDHKLNILESNGCLGRLTKEEVERAISDYPGRISKPPAESYQDIVIYDVYDEASEARKVEFDLWYEGEVSDLTLSLDVYTGDEGRLKVEIEDIHIL